MIPHSAIIIDDEPGSIRALQWEIDQLGGRIEVVGTTSDPREGAGMIQHLDPELLFVDIAMPGLSGFEVVEAARPFTGHLVFTTAYDRFAIRAFEVSALDYLLKPITQADLLRVLGKLATRSTHQRLQEQLALLAERLDQRARSPRTIAVPTDTGLEFIRLDQVVRFEADGNYTRIHLSGAKPLIVSKTLKVIEEMVGPAGFARTHHSHLVNLQEVKRMLRGETACLIMRDGATVPVSRGRKAGLLELL